MRVQLCLLTALAVLCGCSHPLDCRKFKNGTFITHYFGHTDLIKRSGNIQLEYVDTGKVPDVFTVKWVNSYTYTLTPQKVNPSRLPKGFKNPVQTVTITAVDSNYYTETSTSNYSIIRMSGDIFKAD